MEMMLADCYFYYYSNCVKGKYCPYRHEPSALGHEVMCNRWLEGNCFNLKCSGRHMIIDKKRDQLQCFWEHTPSGCLKPHCVFYHSLRRNINRNDGCGGGVAVVDAADGGAFGGFLMHAMQQNVQLAPPAVQPILPDLGQIPPIVADVVCCDIQIAAIPVVKNNSEQGSEKEDVANDDGNQLIENNNLNDVSGVSSGALIR